MRIGIHVVYEAGKLWFEVGAERSSGDALAFGASTITVAEALSRAIADAQNETNQDVEFQMTIQLMERLRSILGPAKLVH